MLQEINTIKSIKTAQSAFASLSSAYAQIVGSANAEHHDWMFRRACHFKPNGLAWWRDRCRSVANNIVQQRSTISTFIQPSQETLQWGGFLGGEHVVYTDEAAEHRAVAEVRDIVAEALQSSA
jgi:hypothetical protein